MEHEPARERSRGRTGRGQVKDAAIGVLAIKPSTAAELCAELGDFGITAPSQDYLYRALGDLVHEGLVRRSAARWVRRGDITSKRGRPKLIYGTTPAGRAYLRKWMQSPLSESLLQSELLLRIAVCGRSDFPNLIKLVIELERSYVERIGELDDGVKNAIASASALRAEDWHGTRQLLCQRTKLAEWRACAAWLKTVHERLAEDMTGPDDHTPATVCL